LRANVYSLIPLTNEDISRIEVVSGPGSALYGPNSANGVMHLITHSPFESEGTSLSIGGGGRDFLNFSSRAPVGGRNIYTASLRHARRFSDRIGFKVSAQYFQGRDWESYLPIDVAPRRIQFGIETSAGRKTLGTPVINQADFDVEKIGAETRLDFRLSENAALIFNGGYNQISQVELTGIGAAQGVDWKYIYAQARFNYKNLFVQGFINGSNAGDTYILRSGNYIRDNSKIYVGQVQHGLSFGEAKAGLSPRQRFTYGVDAILTRPDTKNTINGRNEDQDNIDEVGVYLQSETKVFSKLDLVAAGRIDDHSEFEDPVFSPRAALVFKPSADHNLRLTYNRAYSTPSTSTFFLDILVASVANPLNPNKPLIALRARGVPETGYTFRRGSDGRPLMFSQLAPGVGYVPATVNTVWPALRQILIAQSPAQIQALLNATLPPSTQLSGTPVLGDLRSFNGATQKFDLVKDVRNVVRLRPEINNTFEFGYKGVLGEKLLVALDVYHTRRKDFNRLATISQTPNVFANPQQLAAALQPTAVAITQALIAQGLPPAQAQAQATAIVTGLVTSAAQLPLGVISPEQIQNDTDVIFTYDSFGEKDISLNGLDLALTYYANPSWVFSGSYSFVTEQGFNLFKSSNRVYYSNVAGVADVAYNAPGHKAGLSIQYRDLPKGFDAELRGRYVEGFPMRTGPYQGEVQTYTLFDLSLGYDLPFSKNTRSSLSVQNIGDKKHREFIGAPILGRLMLARITQSF
jgi:iron complex outermembrane receptor protein